MEALGTIPLMSQSGFGPAASWGPLLESALLSPPKVKLWGTPGGTQYPFQPQVPRRRGPGQDPEGQNVTTELSMPMVTLVLGWPGFLKDRGATQHGALPDVADVPRVEPQRRPVRVPCPLFQGSQDGPSFRVIFFPLEY